MKKIKVKMLTSIAGLANPDYDLPEHGYTVGDIVELHPQLAEAWIQSGTAEAVKEKPAVSTQPSAKADEVPTANDEGPAAISTGADETAAVKSEDEAEPAAKPSSEPRSQRPRRSPAN